MDLIYEYYGKKYKGLLFLEAELLYKPLYPSVGLSVGRLAGVQFGTVILFEWI